MNRNFISFVRRVCLLLDANLLSIKFRILAASATTAGWLMLALMLGYAAGRPGLLVASAVIVFLAGLLLLAILCQLDRIAAKQVVDERSAQALTGLYYALKPRRPLPYFRNAALATDTCLEYVRLIERLKPEVVVELGSGSSTVIAAYQLEKNAKGRVIAIDHEEKWGGITSRWLEDHGLTGWGEVRTAPLEKVSAGGTNYLWYAKSLLNDVSKIDILLIDGPPDTYGMGTRFPGLDLLRDRMSASGVIIVDDCVMPRWRKIVTEWAAKNGYSVETHFLNEKDSLFLYRGAPCRDDIRDAGDLSNKGTRA